MKHPIVVALSVAILAVISIAPVSAADSPAFAAASKFAPDITWNKKTALTGDFSCAGQKEPAIAGRNKKEIVVAVFVRGLNQAPDLLRIPIGDRDPSLVTLEADSQDFNPKQFISEVGEIPQGMRPSKTCKGINLSDGRVDAAHIYWNHQLKQFSYWSN